MRKILFDPPSGLNPQQQQWWTEWQDLAAERLAAMEEARREGRQYDLDSNVWRRLKDWLFVNIFNRKCAYCEARVRAVYPGDGEHYRPKGNVKIRVDGVKKPVTDGSGRSHPGYYWLAYDWRNLLPACFHCNNAKSDQFPVAASHVHVASPAPADLDRLEAPLLINPYFDDPDEYLVFADFGVVAAKDGNERGQATIEVFDLNRDDLVDERHRRQEESVLALGMAILEALRQGKPVREIFQPWVAEDAPYSAAVQAYANIRLSTVDRQI